MGENFNEYVRITLYILIGVLYLWHRHNIAKRRQERQAPAPAPQEVVVPERKTVRKAAQRKATIPNFTTSYDTQYFTYENDRDFELASRKSPKSAASYNEPQKPIEQTHEAEQQGSDSTSKEFNLREAVIYSEILKPKFDEQ